MRIFEPDFEIKTYTYPTIKLAICAIIFVIIFNRNEIFPFLSEFKVGKMIFTAISALLSIACIFCVYVSVDEIIELYARRVEIRKNMKRDISELRVKQYAVDEIVKLVENEDIIVIEIKTSHGIVKIGSSSDMTTSGIFFDKLYYCGKQEFKTLEEFKAAMTPYSTRGVVKVISIDDVPIDKY